MAWFEACWVELEFGVLRDGVEVVEVEAVIGGVLRRLVVYWHTTQPADCMLCFALMEECGFVFFELACGLADSWHVVTALWCFVLSSPWMSYSGVSFLPDLQYFTYFVIIVM
nr:MAG TPA: hypothetical protein [Caudoviricetes sp.]